MLLNIANSARFCEISQWGEWMNIDFDAFYREVTTQIFSTLDITKAMERTLEVLRKVMPADQMEYMLLNPNERTTEIIASAGKLPGKERPKLVSVPKQIIDLAQDILNSKQPYMEVVNSPKEFSFLKHSPELIDYFKEFLDKQESMIMLLLKIDGINVAQLQLTAVGLNRYTQEHADLIMLLHEPFAIAAANALAHQKVLQLQALIEDDNQYLRQEIINLTGNRIIGEEFGLREVMTHVNQVASSSSPVLLIGETGVGKDLIANSLHLYSARRDRPLIKVNCGAIPDSLIDSELFGHEKGAFTGAIKQKRGRFERAHTGTIFLDEVGELPPQAQVRLLRVLQNGEIERVGGSETMQVDARVVAATNRDLTDMLEKKTFREDLFFRLNVFPIVIPPLRQRKSDIPALVHYFIQKKKIHLKLAKTPTLSPGSLDALIQHDWPGNVRELENIIERSMILFQDGVLRFDQLLTHRNSMNNHGWAIAEEHIMSLDEMIATHIRRALKATEGKIHGESGAAAVLKMNPSTLRSKMKKLGMA